MMKPLGKEHTQRSLHYLAEHEGIEMTPNEIIAERKAAYETIRQGLRDAGFPSVLIPATDEGMFRFLQRYYSRKG